MSSVLWKASVSSACQEDPVAPLITVSIFKLSNFYSFIFGKDVSCLIAFIFVCINNTISLLIHVSCFIKGICIRRLVARFRDIVQ